MTVVEAPGVEQRTTDALLACVARFGLAKTTLDDIAREAGCSRATLYRYFDGKAAIVRRTVNDEVARMTGAAVDAGLDAATLDRAVVAVTVSAARSLSEHAPLCFLLAHEPESIVSHLAFAEGDRVIVWVGNGLAPAFLRFVTAADARRAGEWVARVLRSYVLMPHPSIDLTDPRAARDFLSELVVPGIAATGGDHG
jgi:AcrR family transcriptional regulator